MFNIKLYVCVFCAFFASKVELYAPRQSLRRGMNQATWLGSPFKAKRIESRPLTEALSREPRD